MTDLKKYKRHFDLAALPGKLRKAFYRIGIQSVYTILLLSHAYRRKETPFWAKSIIVGVIGYFISPLDAIPDLTPMIGYTDDIGVLSFGLVTVAAYINQDIRLKAKEGVRKLFNNIDEPVLEMVDKHL